MACCFKVLIFLTIAAGTVGTSSEPAGCFTGEEQELDENSCLQVQVHLGKNEAPLEAMAVNSALRSNFGGAAAPISSQMHSSPTSSGVHKTTQMELYGFNRFSRDVVERFLKIPKTTIPIHEVVFDAVARDQNGAVGRDQNGYQSNLTAVYIFIAFMSLCLLVAAALGFAKKDIPKGSKSEGLQIGEVLFTCAGTLLEWFDFGVYGFFAVQIGDAYFPTGDQVTTVLVSFATYAGGYAMRPVGGTLFGYIGDVHGRVVALTIALAGMVAGTCAIGLLPRYSQIGVASPILAVLARLMQGLSVGGQVVGSYIYTMERCSPERRCFFSSVLFVTINLGMMLASYAATVVAGFDQQWSWRVPFVAASVFGILGAWTSFKAEEAQEFSELRASGEVRDNPIREAFTQGKTVILQGVIMCALFGNVCTGLYVWMPTYQVALKTPPLPTGFELNTVALIAVCLLGAFFGWLADHGNWEKLMYCSAVLMTILLAAVFVTFDSTNPELVLATYMVLSVPFSAFGALLPRWLVDRAPDPSIRFVTLGLSYGLGMACFAGTIPMVSTMFVASDWGLMGVGLYMCCLSALGASALPWKQVNDPVNVEQPNARTLNFHMLR